MATTTADQLKALIRTHNNGEDDQFRSIVLQIAEKNAKNERLKLELQDLANRVRFIRLDDAIKVVHPHKNLDGMLRGAASPKVRIRDLFVGESTLAILERILVEQRAIDRIKAADEGLSPLRKILLAGPTGTGKTLTASVIAGELELPIFRIQLDGIIGSYLGESQKNLRSTFEAIASTRAVYLFDEFDALGATRSIEGKDEIGEMRRLTNSLLMMLDEDVSSSIIIAATNYRNILDGALPRRFDAVIEYSMPTAKIAEDVMKHRLGKWKSDGIIWPEVCRVANGLCHADLVRSCEIAMKETIIAHKSLVEHEALVGALRERQDAKSESSKMNMVGDISEKKVVGA